MLTKVSTSKVFLRVAAAPGEGPSEVTALLGLVCHYTANYTAMAFGTCILLASSSVTVSLFVPGARGAAVG